jgi:energy-coupling factor transporter ATP-binding protein EcfA2
MPKYVKLYNEFLGFLDSTTVSDKYETKLINLILAHFDEIVETGTGYGKRSELIRSLIQKEGSTVSDVLSSRTGQGAAKSFPFTTLESLRVSDFRGFSKEESFKFDKRFTFIYGPNGSGKSSFCEALEYAMLGYINEAINRRIEISQYIQNNFTGKAGRPTLKGCTKDKTVVNIEANPALYHFCFIEKNRIEDFSRISANTPKEKQNLLASLFGLDEFNAFVKNFNENIDAYIDIVGAKNKELETKAQALRVHEGNLSRADKESLAIKEQMDKLPGENGYKTSFEDFVEYIQGRGKQNLSIVQQDSSAGDGNIKDSNSSVGRLSEINELLSKPFSTEISISNVEKIDRDLGDLKITIEKRQKLQDQYDQSRDKVKFRHLYEAVIALEDHAKDMCPVCETPADKTVKHPYDNSREKLGALASIAELEQQLDSQVKEIRLKLNNLSRVLEKRSKAAEQLSFSYPGSLLDLTSIDDLNAFSLSDAYHTFYQKWNETKSSHDNLDSMIQNHNEVARTATARRLELGQERTKLQGLLSTITELKTKLQVTQNNIASYNNEIAQFNKENAKLIQAANNEKPIIAENKKYVTAYKSFLTKLKNYMNQLPIQHIQHLNSLTIELYNGFNLHDKPFEIASNILLPKSADEPIRISFKNVPDRYHNALQILSEGHIRCLGLAILLAKNIHDGSPIIVFDDVVNAIDDDHRGGVREVLFTYPGLGSKQIILTTHANEFVKELEQHPTKSEYEGTVSKLVFYIDPTQRLIRVKSDAQQNYLYKAESECTTGHWSEALYNCRCCLENLAHKLWKRLGRMEYKTEFSVVIRSQNAPPDLMSVVSSINKFLKDHNANDEYTALIANFDYLLGLKVASPIIWTYLNKGTHEEEGRPEFDQLIVKNIVNKLIDMDNQIKLL